jgi:hypothetical protein
MSRSAVFGWGGRVFLMVGLLLGTASCDPLLPRSVGVRIEGASVHVSTPLCPRERVNAITVFEVRGNVIGDADDVVLWRTAGEPGIEVPDIVLGDVPPGWSETRSFPPELPKEARMAVQLGTTLTTRLSPTFDPSELRSTEVLTEDGYVPLEDLQARGVSGCPED